MSVKIHAILGGAIMLLLPFLLFSRSNLGFLISNSYSDNLYFIGETKNGGNKTEFSPFLSFSGFMEFDYSGEVSIIDFNEEDVFFGNRVDVQKTFSLPGLGNRNYLYINVYNFTPLNYSNYGLNEIYGGDSLSLYIGNFLLGTGVRIGYVDFNSDSIENYFNPGIKTSLAIPMPYFYFTPGVDAGFMFYENERLSYYDLSLSLDFPLAGDFTISVSGNYFRLSEPLSNFPISDSLLLDSFFDREGMVRNITLDLSVSISFAEQKSYLNLYMNLFEKNFFEIGDILRNDSGFFAYLQYMKVMNNNVSFFVDLSSQINNSTIENLNYTRNSIGAGMQLIF